MGITEPGFHVQRLREVLVSGEFGFIVEGDGAARELGQAPEDSPQEPVSGLGCLALQRGGQGETRDALASASIGCCAGCGTAGGRPPSGRIPDAEAGLYSPLGRLLRRSSRLIVEASRPIRWPIS